MESTEIIDRVIDSMRLSGKVKFRGVPVDQMDLTSARWRKLCSFLLNEVIRHQKEDMGILVHGKDLR